MKDSYILTYATQHNPVWNPRTCSKWSSSILGLSHLFLHLYSYWPEKMRPKSQVDRTDSNNGESPRDLCLCAFHRAWSGHPHLGRSEIQQHSVLHRPIRHNPQPRQPASGFRLRRARLPRHGGPVFSQRRMDCFRRRLRHHPDLGDPQRLRSQEWVSDPVGSYRWPPVVPRRVEDSRMWGWQGKVLCSRFYVSAFMLLRFNLHIVI